MLIKGKVSVGKRILRKLAFSCNEVLLAEVKVCAQLVGKGTERGKEVKKIDEIVAWKLSQMRSLSKKRFPLQLGTIHECRRVSRVQ